LRSATYRRIHRYYERFTANSFIQGENGAGDDTAGEDPVVRQAAIDALGDMNGTAVVINPTNGRILAMVNQKLARRILERLGADVTVADNGEAAIAELTGSAFDVVLMDCQMPVLDGYEATRRIRAGAAGSAASTIPVIALTAHALSGDRDRCLEAGMNEYLTKPIDPHALKCRLEELLSTDQDSRPSIDQRISLVGENPSER